MQDNSMRGFKKLDAEEVTDKVVNALTYLNALCEVLLRTVFYVFSVSFSVTIYILMIFMLYEVTINYNPATFIDNIISIVVMAVIYTPFHFVAFNLNDYFTKWLS